MGNKSEITERQGRLRSGERELTIAGVKKLANDNPIFHSLNRETIKAKFAGGWDPNRFTAPETVWVKTADGPKEFFIDGFHRFGIYVANLIHAGKLSLERDYVPPTEIVLEDIGAKHPHFKYTVMDVTESSLNNPHIVHADDEIVEVEGKRMLNPEQLVRAIITPTNEQAAISQERFVLHLMDLWEHKVGNQLTKRYSPLSAFMVLGLDIKEPLDKVFTNTTKHEMKALSQGLSSLIDTINIPELNLTPQKAFIEILKFTTTDRDPKTGEMKPDARKRIKSILSLPVIQEKIKEKKDKPAEDLLVDQIITRTNHIIATRALEDTEIIELGNLLIDPLLNFDQTVRLIDAEDRSERERIYQSINEQNARDAYLKHTKKTEADLSTLEKTIISQKTRTSTDTITPLPHMEEIIQTIKAIRENLKPVNPLQDKIKACKQSHPHLKNILEKKLAELNALQIRFINYPTQRNPNTLHQKVAAIEAFLEEQLAATQTQPRVDQDKIATPSPEEPSEVTIAALREELAEKDEIIARLEAELARERTRTAELEKRIIFTPASHTEFRYDPSKDGSKEWFSGLKLHDGKLKDGDRHKVTGMINDSAKKIFPELEENWDDVLQQINTASGLRGLPAIDKSFANQLGLLTKSSNWGRKSDEFNFLTGNHFALSVTLAIDSYNRANPEATDSDETLKKLKRYEDYMYDILLAAEPKLPKKLPKIWQFLLYAKPTTKPTDSYNIVLTAYKNYIQTSNNPLLDNIYKLVEENEDKAGGVKTIFASHLGYDALDEQQREIPDVISLDDMNADKLNNLMESFFGEEFMSETKKHVDSDFLMKSLIKVSEFTKTTSGDEFVLLAAMSYLLGLEKHIKKSTAELTIPETNKALLYSALEKVKTFKLKTQDEKQKQRLYIFSYVPGMDKADFDRIWQDIERENEDLLWEHLKDYEKTAEAARKLRSLPSLRQIL